MDSNTINALLEQMKEKEERDAAYAKKIKEGEAAIKAGEENIKQLQFQKHKLKEENNKKQLEFSRKTIDYELLLKQKEIWTELYERTCSELKEKRMELDAVQQSVFTNRKVFCDDINDFVDQHGLLQMSRGIFKPRPSSLTKTIQVKTEQEEDEYNRLLGTVKILEQELEELNTEEAEVEEVKQCKSQLLAEPTCGENFIRLRNTLKDMKDNLEKAEEKVKKVKSDIALTELKILSKKQNQNKEKEFQMLNSQVSHGELLSSAQRETNQKKTNDLKVVKFNQLVETRQIKTSPQLKGILKTTNFKVKSPSPSLRKRLTSGLISNLDLKMNSILFDDKKSTDDLSSNNPLNNLQV